MFKFLLGVAFGAAGYWAWQSFGRDLLGLGNDQDTYSSSGYSGTSSTGSFSASPSTSSFGSSATTGGASATTPTSPSSSSPGETTPNPTT